VNHFARLSPRHHEKERDREDHGGRSQWRWALPRAGLESRVARMP
jgi:hypothetical protein